MQKNAGVNCAGVVYWWHQLSSSLEPRRSDKRAGRAARLVQTELKGERK